MTVLLSIGNMVLRMYHWGVSSELKPGFAVDWVPDALDEEDMAAKGLVLHLAMALDEVRLVTATEVRDGVIILTFVEI